MIKVERTGVKGDRSVLNSIIKGSAEELVNELYAAIVQVFHIFARDEDEEYARENIKIVLKHANEFVNTATLAELEEANRTHVKNTLEKTQ